MKQFDYETMETVHLSEYCDSFDHVILVTGVEVFIVIPYRNNRRRNIPDWIGSLSATTVEMLDHGFFKSYDELYEVLFDRPSEAIKSHNLPTPNISYGEGPSSSHSEAPLPQVFNDGSALDCGINNRPLKNKVSIDIPEHEKHPFVDGLNGILSEGINSPLGLGDYVSIDIPSVVINQQWKDYISGELDRKKRDYTVISDSTLAIAGQAVGALLSSTFSLGSSSKEASWTANFVAAATVLGVGFTLSGVGLRRVKPKLSGIMTKLGAIATASAIILALGSTVVPAVAWTAGPVACLLISVGVAVA